MIIELKSTDRESKLGFGSLLINILTLVAGSCALVTD